MLFGDELSGKDVLRKELLIELAYSMVGPTALSHENTSHQADIMTRISLRSGEQGSLRQVRAKEYRVIKAC